MEFDLVEFINVAMKTGAFLLPLNFALGKAYGDLGLSGKLQLVAVLVSGLILGIGSMLAQLGIPADFAGWFGNVIFGLVVGLGSAGFYEAIQKAAEKPTEQ